MEHDHYRILGVPPDATPEAIRAAYRRRARECHPDRGGSHEAMLLVNKAWEILSDPDRRRHYDEARAGRGGRAVREAAEADGRRAQQRAAEYPRRWADFEVWLNRVAGDFAGAKYKSGAGMWDIPWVGNSISGPVFIIVGMIAGGLTLLLLQSGLARWGAMNIKMVALGGLAGAWLGAIVHKAIGDTILQQRGRPGSVGQPADNRRRIIPCERCRQKLRIPNLGDDIIAKCGRCGYRFTVEGMAEQKSAGDDSGRGLTVPRDVGCLLMGSGLLLLIFLANGCPKGAKDSGTKFRTDSPSQWGPSSAATARLSVSGRDGTDELHQLTAGLSQEEAALLGLSVILTGTDIYGARIRITNTGSVPVRVFPDNIRIHFGRDSVGVVTIDHAWFLRRGILQPGDYVEGLVMYQARVDIGAVMRLGAGSFSYNDESIQVTYHP